VSILHVELFENCGDEGLLGKTDATTVFLRVDFVSEQLARRAVIDDSPIFGEPGLNFDRSFQSIFWVQHQDVVEVQKHQNTITTEIEFGVGQGLCELERDQEGGDMVGAKSLCLCEAIQCLL